MACLVDFRNGLFVCLGDEQLVIMGDVSSAVLLDKGLVVRPLSTISNRTRPV